MVDDSYESGLAGAVGAEESVDFSFADVHRHVIEGNVAGVLLDDVVGFE